MTYRLSHSLRKYARSAGYAQLSPIDNARSRFTVPAAYITRSSSTSRMAPQTEDDDFGFGSEDDAEFLCLVEDVEHNISSKQTLDEFGDLDEDGLLEAAESFESSQGQSSKRSGTTGSNAPPAKRVDTSQKKFPSALKALTASFGMKAFRLKQEQAISKILDGESAAVVFPTGGGKSLIFQIPALVFAEEDKIAGIRGEGEHGVTLVVSPLIALMKDQVDALVRRGIKAASFDSSKSREEYLHTCDLLRSGQLQLLYCAPERLNNEGFIEQMKYVRGGIRLLAVDEAHCISEWGHAFRPDYLKIARFAEEINAERVVCLTATATPRVATDICNAFKIEESSSLFRTSTYRPNLQLIAMSGKTKKDLYPSLYKFLKDNPGPAIIYVTLQRHTEELALLLERQGFQARSFHAGMQTAAKTEVQDAFMKRDDLIIVATIAFGMGIDKPNIRNVVHFSIPSSLESYSQEIGRAGRDGALSKCMFFLCGEDLHLSEIFARCDLPSLASIRNLMDDIFADASLPIGSELRFSHYTQGRDFDIRSTTLGNIYAQLELTHSLIRATTPVYTKYTYTAGPEYTSRLSSDNSQAAKTIMKYGKKASKLHHIDIDNAAMRVGMPRADIVRKLNDMSEAGYIELKPAGVLAAYRTVAKVPASSREKDRLAREIYATIEQRERDALQRTKDMLRLITSEECFSAALAKHFGDELPTGVKECGHCTWCMTKKAVVQEMPPAVPFNNSAFRALLASTAVRDDPRLLARIAFGISSPRVSVLKLGRSPVFGSMEDHKFMDLLNAFTKECAKAK